jgi:hypothetical protein
MLERLFAVADSRAALTALAIFLVSLVMLIVLDPRKELPKKFAEEQVEYLPIGATYRPRVDDFKKMLGVYYKHLAYADLEKRFLVYDFFFLLVYGLAGVVILAYLLPAAWPRWLALVPALIALFDAVENTTMYVCLGSDPDRYSGLLVVSRWATALKWLLTVVNLILFLVCVFKLALPAALSFFRRART